MIRITTSPFDMILISWLEREGYSVQTNPYHRRLIAEEIPSLLRDAEGVIAGTEPYNEETLLQANRLKVISRVGVGYDNIDLVYCRKNLIKVVYTPVAPADSVADLTVGNIINLFRGIHISDRRIRNGAWNRYMGKQLDEVKIGILGVGRIGKRVIKRLQAFGVTPYACDLNPDWDFGKLYNITWMSKNELFKMCDLVTVHIPMSKENFHCVGDEQMCLLGFNYLINASRGSIVDEEVLIDKLQSDTIAGAALDVFEKEPYVGPLTEIKNTILTPHIGSSTVKSRFDMEKGAAENCVNVLKGKKVSDEFVII